jgi:hypothetical protein
MRGWKKRRRDVREKIRRMGRRDVRKVDEEEKSIVYV